ncbi:MAG: ion transporter [SAR324 cluster bacterium]|nr:ion transporter [SAR324 cluster bacterium]
MSDLKHTVFRLLEPGDSDDKASRIVDGFIISLILINGVISVLETVPGLHDLHGTFFEVVEITSVIIFTVEYVLRLWSCTATGRSSLWGRLRYALQPMLLVDLAAILPFFLYFLGLDLRMVRMLRLTRLFRIAKLARYSSGMRMLAAAVASRKEELLLTLMMGFFALVFSATLIYYAESERQPELFSSIPASFWWAVTTLTTVGYGDAYPLTSVGKFVGGLVQVVGISLFALPTGLLTSAFMEQIAARKESRQSDVDAQIVPTVCPYCSREIGS